MNLRFYKDNIEQEIRLDLECLITEALEFSALAEKAEENAVKN